MKGGYLIAGRLWGAPIRFHWSVALGALFFGRFQWVPGFWAAFFALILIHELGHALMVRAFRRRLLSVDVHGFGGWCAYSGSATSLEVGVIAWGGVLAQAVVALLAYAILGLYGWPTSPEVSRIAILATSTNLMIIAFNLLPIAPLDGADAWPVVPRLWARWTAAWAQRRRQRKEASQRRRAIRKAEREVRQQDLLEGRSAELPSSQKMIEDIDAMMRGSEPPRTEDKSKDRQ